MKSGRVKKDGGKSGRSKTKHSDGEESFKKLKKIIQNDESLQKKLGELRTGDDLYKALSRLGEENGLSFRKRDFKRIVADPDRPTDELTSDEITSMAGGFHLYPPKTAQVEFGNTLIQTLRWFNVPLRR